MRRINTRPWKRPPWRRRRRGVLFAPIGKFGENGEGIGTAIDTCFADIGTTFGSIELADRTVWCPILGNRAQGLEAVDIDDAGVVNKPTVEKWRVSRIFGTMEWDLFDARGGQQGPFSMNFYWAIIKMPIAHNASPNIDLDLPQLDENQECLRHYVSGPHQEIIAAENDPILATKTSFEVFGVPTVIKRKVNLRTRVAVSTEEELGIVLNIPRTPDFADGDFELSWLPKLRCAIRRSV